jgi:putative membrane protein insertion efficiency factor
MLIKPLLLNLINLYRKLSFRKNIFLINLITSIKGVDFGMCRYSPTCSNYMYEAIEHYGIVKGVYLGVKRLIRCHPWAKGGFDPLPK